MLATQPLTTIDPSLAWLLYLLLIFLAGTISTGAMMSKGARRRQRKINAERASRKREGQSGEATEDARRPRRSPVTQRHPAD